MVGFIDVLEVVGRATELVRTAKFQTKRCDGWTQGSAYPSDGWSSYDCLRRAQELINLLTGPSFIGETVDAKFDGPLRTCRSLLDEAATALRDSIVRRSALTSSSSWASPPSTSSSLRAHEPPPLRSPRQLHYSTSPIQPTSLSMKDVHMNTKGDMEEEDGDDDADCNSSCSSSDGQMEGGVDGGSCTEGNDDDGEDESCCSGDNDADGELSTKRKRVEDDSCSCSEHERRTCRGIHTPEHQSSSKQQQYTVTDQHQTPQLCEIQPHGTHQKNPKPAPPSPPSSAPPNTPDPPSALLAGLAPPSSLSTSPPLPTPTLLPPTPFSSLVGGAEVKRALFEHIVLPLQLPKELRDKLFARVGGLGDSRNSGSNSNRNAAGGGQARAASCMGSNANCLLYGPPGTGKTTLAKAACYEASASFFPISPSTVLSKYQGESEKELRQVFEQAKRRAPSIIFMDEVDALAPSREGLDDIQSRRLLAELLMQLTALTIDDRVMVVAATNRLEDVDVAFLRRFHARIFVPNPSKADRREIAQRFADQVEHELTEQDLTAIAERTVGWSGSDLMSLCKEASMGPVRTFYSSRSCKEILSMDPEAVQLRPVVMQDIEDAYTFLMTPTSGEEEEDEVKVEAGLEARLDVGAAGGSPRGGSGHG